MPPMMSRPESADVSTWIHVSPGRHLDAILADGLQVSPDGGNYAGYETSLDGVYVSRNKAILRSHVCARDMDDHHLLVLVEVGPDAGALVDEDAVHSWLETSTLQVLQERGLHIRDAVDGDIEPGDAIWSRLPAALARNLGRRDDAVAARHPGLVDDYVEAWIRQDLYGEDADPLWWPGAKDAMVRMFPDMGHPAWKEDFLSRRIPQAAVGYQGPARIVGIVEALGGHPRMAYGTLPDDVANLVADMLRDPECCPDPLEALCGGPSPVSCR